MRPEMPTRDVCCRTALKHLQPDGAVFRRGICVALRSETGTVDAVAPRHFRRGCWAWSECWRCSGAFTFRRSGRSAPDKGIKIKTVQRQFFPGLCATVLSDVSAGGCPEAFHLWLYAVLRPEASAGGCLEAFHLWLYAVLRPEASAGGRLETFSPLALCRTAP